LLIVDFILYFSKMWSGAKTEQRMRQVHEANLKSAHEAGMTLEEWHDAMSKKGREVQPVLVKKKLEKQPYVPQTAVEQVLRQLFPTVHKD
jgi:hypothetical protein